MPEVQHEHIVEQLRALATPIETLVLDPSNARVHDERNIAAVMASLKTFGQRFPVVVQAGKNIVRAGNARLEAAKRLGWTHIAAIFVDESDVEATAFAIADNRTAELAGWDDGALAQLAPMMDREPIFDESWFNKSDISSLLDRGDDCGIGSTGVDEIPDKVDAKCSLGDLWLLGEHRLLCGDSTALADVKRVMNGEKAALIATDPPYLVDYTGERPNNSGKDWTDVYHEIDIKDADGFFRSVFTNAVAVIAPNAAIYCWHAHKRQAMISKVWSDLGILDHQQIVWVKPSPVFGRVYWHFQHEPCMMGWIQGSKPEHNGNHEFTSVWEIDWDGKSKNAGDHPTEKPTEIFARPMKKHTTRGDVCFEPFSGSGSQIIAAEKLNRKCYAIEIEPVFVDVAIARWEAISGEEAVLEDQD